MIQRYHILAIIFIIVASLLFVNPVLSIRSAGTLVKEYFSLKESISSDLRRTDGTYFELKEQLQVLENTGYYKQKSAEDIVNVIEGIPGCKIDSISTLRFAYGKIYTVQTVTDINNIGYHEGIQIILSTDDINSTLNRLSNLGIIYEELDVLGPAKIIDIKINFYSTTKSEVNPSV